ncbi:GNAT family N-acetyltransferase [Bacillus salacetis]|uniref:GNAT family N-acetyltransferase n=1 Tax=Bacillus salacetis TaxID=2315464 RepID=A0A3A1R4K0_9BACI|nr:GNAT family N-acetyltransferase [Bacillus salacetis]RIW37287.1 GNAT family N-acetyltransferase [Bacillus salacetis]
MEILEIRPEDAVEILTMFRETIHHVNARDYNPQQLDAWTSGSGSLLKREEWANAFRENFSYKAILDGRIAGFADMTDNGFLDRLYVHKDYQGQGVASCLLQKLEEEAFHHNLTEIVTFASITAKPFFEKRGFLVQYCQRVSRNGVHLVNYKMVKEGI